eukprot:jgi/Mesen1/8163/ME000438S07275
MPKAGRKPHARLTPVLAVGAAEDAKPANNVDSEPPPSSFSGWELSSVAKVGGGAAVVGLGLLLLLYLLPGSPSEWLQWAEERLKEVPDLVDHAGPAGPLIFAAAYVASALLFLPASVLTVAAGYLFGTLKGTAIVSAAATTGGPAAAFLIARYAARPLVAAQLAKVGKFEAVDRAISEDGLKIVFLWRLSPLFPFALSNYMFGVTGVQFWPYVGASWLGMLPGTFAYVYLGGAGRATIDSISDGGSGGIPTAKLLLYGVGAVATLLVTREVSVRASRAIKEAEERSADADSRR